MTGELFRLTGTVRHDPVIGIWFHERGGELGQIARRWFEVMRDLGDDRRLEIHFRHSLGLVTYHVRDLAVEHSAWMRVSLGAGGGNHRQESCGRPRKQTQTAYNTWGELLGSGKRLRWIWNFLR